MLAIVRSMTGTTSELFNCTKRRSILRRKITHQKILQLSRHSAQLVLRLPQSQ